MLIGDGRPFSSDRMDKKPTESNRSANIRNEILINELCWRLDAEAETTDGNRLMTRSHWKRNRGNCCLSLCVSEWGKCGWMATVCARWILSVTALDNNNTNSFQLVNLIGDRNHRILKKDKTKKKTKINNNKWNRNNHKNFGGERENLEGMLTQDGGAGGGAGRSSPGATHLFLSRF